MANSFLLYLAWLYLDTSPSPCPGP